MAKRNLSNVLTVRARRSATLRADALEALNLSSDSARILPFIKEKAHVNRIIANLRWPPSRVETARRILFMKLGVTNCDAARTRIKTLGL